jgi:hypothetical protein
MHHVLQRTHLLIVGAPRSGTTLLASLVGGHPDISIVSEDKGSEWLHVAGKSVVGVKLCTPHHIELHTNRRAWRGRRLPSLRRGKPSSIWSISEFLGLPNAKILAIERAQQDVVVSNMRRAGWSENYANACCKRALEIVSHISCTHPRQILNICYEDLVTDRQAVLSNVCTFLGVSRALDSMSRGESLNPIYPWRADVIT